MTMARVDLALARKVLMVLAVQVHPIGARDIYYNYGLFRHLSKDDGHEALDKILRLLVTSECATMEFNEDDGKPALWRATTAAVNALEDPDWLPGSPASVPSALPQIAVDIVLNCLASSPTIWTSVDSLHEALKGFDSPIKFTRWTCVRALNVLESREYVARSAIGGLGERLWALTTKGTDRVRPRVPPLPLEGQTVESLRDKFRKDVP